MYSYMLENCLINSIYDAGARSPSILETSEWQPPPPLWWALGSKVGPTTRNKKLSFILKSVLVELTARAQFCCKCPQLKHRTTLCRCCHLVQGRSSRGANTEPRTPLNMVGVLHDGLRCFPGFKRQRHVLSANIVIKNTYLQHFAKIFRPVGPPRCNFSSRFETSHV